MRDLLSHTYEPSPHAARAGRGDAAAYGHDYDDNELLGHPLSPSYSSAGPTATLTPEAVIVEQRMLISTIEARNEALEDEVMGLEKRRIESEDALVHVSELTDQLQSDLDAVSAERDELRRENDRLRLLLGSGAASSVHLRVSPEARAPGSLPPDASDSAPSPAATRAAAAGGGPRDTPPPREAPVSGAADAGARHSRRRPGETAEPDSAATAAADAADAASSAAAASGSAAAHDADAEARMQAMRDEMARTSSYAAELEATLQQTKLQLAQAREASEDLQDSLGRDLIAVTKERRELRDQVDALQAVVKMQQDMIAEAAKGKSSPAQAAAGDGSGIAAMGGGTNAAIHTHKVTTARRMKLFG